MPAFIENGPNIPVRLLHAHEEGKMVFFCGAGISRPAGLPDFKNLVDRLYDELDYEPNSSQQKAMEVEQYDKVIELLEEEHIDHRGGIRKKITQILTPDLMSPQSTAMHEALLVLSQNYEGKIRLVTTNFDRIFEEVIKKRGGGINHFKAPLLPPHNRWHGIVYLHGLLPSPDDMTDENLDHLVLSSGDYGLAYLVEGWAARFISELFRNYTICFIGYSLSDPVLRYIVDAFAAQRRQGGTSEIFAFYNYPKGLEEQTREQWKVKNVTPIVYQEDEKQEHSYLYETLYKWAEVYNHGMYQKEKIVDKYTFEPPKSDFKSDLVLWAITDPVAAKHFSDMNPGPSIEWLEYFSKENDKLKFNIMSRPANNTPSISIHMAYTTNQTPDWDPAMRHLAHWLIRHLNDPKLILWLVQQGGQLDHKFLHLVQDRISYIDNLQKENNKQTLQKIQSNDPNAIPSPLMLTVWRLLLSGRFSPQICGLDFPTWCNHFHQYGLTDDLLVELRNLLTPYIKIGGLVNNQSDIPDNVEHIQDIFYCSIGLSSSDFLYSMLKIRDDNRDFKRTWMDIFPKLLPYFTELLRDALDLKHKIDGVKNLDTEILFDYPSIDSSPKEDEPGRWTVLIDLTRDAWRATLLTDRERAKRAAEDWWDVQ